MKLLFTIFLVCATVSFCFAQHKTDSNANAAPKTELQDTLQKSIPVLSYKIIPAPGKTWGYNIYSEGKLVIHQPNVPGMRGNAGFKTKDSAGKVARLVITKIEKGQMPPSVEPEELKLLKVL